MEKSIWQERFRKEVRGDPQAWSTWNLLLKHRCDPAVLEDLLFSIAEEEEEISKEIEHLETEERINSYALGMAILDLASRVSAERACYRGEMRRRLLGLERRMKLVGAELKSDSDLTVYTREMFQSGVPLLATYVLRMSGKTKYYGLGAIVRCARLEPIGRQYRLDSVRKAVDRYRQSQPALWRIINRSVDSLLAEGRKIIPGELHQCFLDMLCDSPEGGQMRASKPKIDVRDKKAAKRYLRKHGKSSSHDLPPGGY